MKRMLTLIAGLYAAGTLALAAGFLVLGVVMVRHGLAVPGALTLVAGVLLALEALWLAPRRARS